MTEPELVQRLKKADEEAFRIVYDTYKSKMYWYCLKFVKSSSLAEEIVQDVFVKLWENKESLYPGTCLGAYLHTIAKHKVLNYLKKEALNAAYKKEQILSSSEIDTQTESGLDYANYLEIANVAITKLPQQRQIIFKMSRQDEMSNQEIALALGISKNTVKVQLVKALKSLRNSLGIKSKLTSLLLLVFNFLF